jgi:hypothetical protein
MMNYYVLRDDVFRENVVVGRWHLGKFLYIDNYKLYKPTVELMEPGTWKVPVYQDGIETDFSINGANGSPVISQKLKDALADIPEIQVPYRHTVIEPVEITNREVSTNYYVMITEDRLDCVDEERSEFQKFEKNDPIRPDLCGNYRTFFNLVIDPKRAQGRNIFRIQRRESALIVSEEIKKRFEAVGATGAVFDSVMGDRRTIA